MVCPLLLGDVSTKHYIVNEVQHLRDPMQQVTDCLKEQCGLITPDNVITLEHRSR